jgi:hypothetical protein
MIRRRAGLLIALACAASFLVLFGVAQATKRRAAPTTRAQSRGANPVRQEVGSVDLGGLARAALIPELRSPPTSPAPAPVVSPGSPAPPVAGGQQPPHAAVPRGRPRTPPRAPVSRPAPRAPVSRAAPPAPISRAAPPPPRAAPPPAPVRSAPRPSPIRKPSPAPAGVTFDDSG